MAIVIFIIFIVLLAIGLVAYFVIFNRKDISKRAIELAESGMFTDARGLLRSKLDRDPNNVSLHQAMIRIYHLEGDEHSELEHMIQLYRIGRSTPDLPLPILANQIASIYYKNEQYSEAFQFYKDALRLVPDNEEALARLAFLCVGQEKFDIADRYFSKLVIIRPNVFEYRLGRGICLSQLRKKEALSEFDAAVGIAPDNLTANLFAGIEGLLQGAVDQSTARLKHALDLGPEPEVEYIVKKALTSLAYQRMDYNTALKYAEQTLQIALDENWNKEEYDARTSVACMAILAGDLEAANENLLTLEMRNMNDQRIINLSDYRMNVEEGLIPAGEPSPAGFNFRGFLNDWTRSRFNSSFIFQISGMKMDRSIDVDSLLTQEGPPKASRRSNRVDIGELIDRFNQLKGQSFETVCRKIVLTLGYKVVSILPYRESDGMDILAQLATDKSQRALFEIRKWENQPISDIFLRNMQNQLNENKAQLGFVIAAARLTDGAAAALQSLNKIKVINEESLGELLSQVLD
ncbi:MAG: restriction endonuclease [Leptonema sp. (in: Bacteria)]|nr:restriction endonuclease [Leptonema sp. (in: bacteria)]